MAGQLPPTEENLQNQSQDTNLHYHGFNVSPLLGSDDVVMHVHSKVTPNPVTVSKTAPTKEFKGKGTNDQVTINSQIGSENYYRFIPDSKLRLTSSTSGNPKENISGGIYPGDDSQPPTYDSIAEYRMRVNLPKGHQSGLFWYHPHAHTVSNNQVRAGMSGGIIVNGIEESYRLLDPKDGIKLNPMYTEGVDKSLSDHDADDLTFNQPSRLAITQQVMLFKDFNDVLDTRKINCFTLNGQIKPIITIQPGEVQLWRIGNIGADQYMNLALETVQGRGDAENGRRGERIQTGTETPTEFKRLKSKISVGVSDPRDLRPRVAASPRRRVFSNEDILKSSEDMFFYILARDSDVVNKPIKAQSVLLPPASRVELLVVGGESGQNYDLVSQPSSEATTYEGILATVKVGKQIVTYLCPDGSPLESCTPPDQSGKIVDYITSQTPAKVDDILPDPSELANYEECKDSDDHTKCITPGDEYSDPLTQKRIFEFNSKQLGKNFVFTINDKLYNENRIDKVSHLGDIEEWQVVNKDTSAHAFHMHQLDFLVTQVKLQTNPDSTYDNYDIKGPCKQEDNTYTCPLEPQGYRDTINLPPNSTTTIRIPFLNPFITGVFVYHCHILGHEDSGMMQNLKVIDPKNYKSTSGLVSNP